MIEPDEDIVERIREAAARAGFALDDGTPIDLEPCRLKDLGDLSSNIALVIASKQKAKPREIAEKIAANLIFATDQYSRVDVAGPGFLNFTIGMKTLYEGLARVLEMGTRYGTSDWGGGKKTMVEFVSANPTGPLTIGHGRQAVLGDTVARLLEATGHRVTREYYFNNAGRQMRMLGESVRLRAQEILGHAVDFPEDHYQGEYIRDIARQTLEDEKFKGLGLDDVRPYQQLAEHLIFEDIKKTLTRLGIVFDVYTNESTFYETGKVDAVIRDLRAKDLAYDQDGAVWFRLTRFGFSEDRVIVKSTGEPTYRLPDIAYHKDKMDRGFDLVVDLFGADHIATYPDVLAGMEALGYDKSRVKVLIHQFVTLLEGKEKVKMSTRKANFVTLDELIDQVGADVTRYFFLNRSMSSHLNFDLTLAKTQSDENPVYYIQYAHARICSILDHARQEGLDPEAPADSALLKAPEEIDLVKILLAFPGTVTRAARRFEPHLIPTYLEEAATFYHRFQHAGKVDPRLRVVTQDRPLASARLALCRAMRTVLANGLILLGVATPKRM